MPPADLCDQEFLPKAIKEMSLLLLSKTDVSSPGSIRMIVPLSCSTLRRRPVSVSTLSRTAAFPSFSFSLPALITVGSETVAGNTLPVSGKCCVLVSSRVNFANLAIGLPVVLHATRAAARAVEVTGTAVGDAVVKRPEKSGGKESVCCCSAQYARSANSALSASSRRPLHIDIHLHGSQAADFRDDVRSQRWSEAWRSHQRPSNPGEPTGNC